MQIANLVRKHTSAFQIGAACSEGDASHRE